MQQCLIAIHSAWPWLPSIRVATILDCDICRWFCMLCLQYFFFFEYIDWEGVLSGCFNPRLQVTQPVLMRFVSHCTTPPSVLPLHSPSVKRRCSAQPCDFFAGWSVRRSNIHPTYLHARSKKTACRSDTRGLLSFQHLPLSTVSWSWAQFVFWNSLTNMLIHGGST